jgi:hypothetical protein
VSGYFRNDCPLSPEYVTNQGIIYKYFDSILENDEPKYDYKFKNGISSERMGIKIIEKGKVFNILDQIIQRQKSETPHAKQ